MSHLRIESLSKVYVDEYRGENVVALDDISFTIEQGEFVSILGPSGCGKTTILNIVAGFIEPSGGRILLGDKPIGGPGPDRGVVFQSFALFPWKTILGNVRFGPKMAKRSRSEQDRVAREFIELVGLTGFEDRYPHELSGGMQQRVGVARVLANDPQLMLMDEPFASVDAQTRMKLQEDLIKVWEERHPTIMLITHDIEEAVFLSDRVIVLTSHPGRLNRDMRIDLPRPRQWANLVRDTRFSEITHEIMGLIMQGSGNADAEQEQEAVGEASP